MVEAAEERPPAGTPPIRWRLLITLPAEAAEQASRVARFYRLRWRIEQTFRALKSDGLGLPDVQLHDAARLFELVAIGLGAAVFAPTGEVLPAWRAAGRDRDSGLPVVILAGER